MVPKKEEGKSPFSKPRRSPKETGNGKAEMTFDKSGSATSGKNDPSLEPLNPYVCVQELDEVSNEPHLTSSTVSSRSLVSSSRGLRKELIKKNLGVSFGNYRKPLVRNLDPSHEWVRLDAPSGTLSELARDALALSPHHVVFVGRGLARVLVGKGVGEDEFR